MARKSGKRKRYAKEARYARLLAVCRDPDRPRRDRTRAARYATALAEQLRILVRPGACEWCRSRRPLERHHWDYAEPLRVTFLCRDCHPLADGFAAGEREGGGV